MLAVRSTMMLMDLNTRQSGDTSPSDTDQTTENQPSPDPIQTSETAPETGWSYHGTPSAPVGTAGDEPQATVLPVSWTAPEFHEYAKGPRWFLAAGAIGLAVSLVAFLLTRDFVSTSVIILVTMILLINAAHRPGTHECAIDSRGIVIAGKARPFSYYKAFTITEEADSLSFTLLPLKRFTPLLTVVFPKEKFDEIAVALQEHLPYQMEITDPIDNLARRLRF